jgi:hypothetical protein
MVRRCGCRHRQNKERIDLKIKLKYISAGFSIWMLQKKIKNETFEKCSFFKGLTTKEVLS